MPEELTLPVATSVVACTLLEIVALEQPLPEIELLPEELRLEDRLALLQPETVAVPQLEAEREPEALTLAEATSVVA